MAESSPDEDAGVLTCTSCGSHESEGVAELGSYCLRCLKCGELVVATSLGAVLSSASRNGSHVEAVLDPRAKDSASGASVAARVLGVSVEHVQTRDPLLEGPVRELGKQIQDIAAAGASLVLRFRQ